MSDNNIGFKQPIARREVENAFGPSSENAYARNCLTDGRGGAVCCVANNILSPRRIPKPAAIRVLRIAASRNLPLLEGLAEELTRAFKLSVIRDSWRS